MKIELHLRTSHWDRRGKGDPSFTEADAGTVHLGIPASGPNKGAFGNHDPEAESVPERIMRIEVICRSHAVSLAGAALQRPRLHPAVVSAIRCGRGIEEARTNAAAIQATVPSLPRVELKSEGLMRPDAPTN